MNKKYMLSAFAAAVLGMGAMWAGGDAGKKAEAPQQEVKADCGGGQCTLPREQKFKMPGIALINPESGEAVLLVQIVHPKAGPQMVGVPIKQDEVGKKLVKEYGIQAVKPGDAEGAKKAEAQAKEKFVMVSGTIKMENKKPELSVEKYESAKDLLAKAQAAAASQKPEAAKVTAN